MSDDFEIKNKRVWIQQGYNAGYAARDKEGSPESYRAGYIDALKMCSDKVFTAMKYLQDTNDTIQKMLIQVEHP
jgi:hypothetical protein